MVVRYLQSVGARMVLAKFLLLESQLLPVVIPPEKVKPPPWLGILRLLWVTGLLDWMGYSY